MPEIKINIPGKPIAQKRHRHFRIGNRVQTYDPSITDKDNIRWKAILDNKPVEPISEPISLILEFYMPRPKSHYHTGKKAGQLKDSAPFRCTTMPDLDNLEKLILDSFNHIYWNDDRQIYSIQSKKVYNRIPRTEITIIWEPS